MKKWIKRVLVLVIPFGVAAFFVLRSMGMFASELIYAPHGLALGGYDPVSYFTDGAPRKGLENYAEEWGGVRWLFASEAHRDLFRMSPEKFAPRFGGYCAYAVAHNYTAKADPEAWTVVEDQLYLNYDMDTQKKWLANRDSFIKAAQGNWPTVLR